MSRTAITQGQWQIVAEMCQVIQALNPNPSYFAGRNNPVERVSWQDCIEFCLRLNEATKKPYRLPSEGEWEYACRAGTNTPFHFGPTLSSQLANYQGNSTYGQGKKGEYLKQTIPVGRFNAPNAWGLHDMHGNVQEWCLDDWHDQGMPMDGTAWINNQKYFQNNVNWLKILLNSNPTANKVKRGGSWYSPPAICCSNYRQKTDPNMISETVGFRVVVPTMV